MLVDARPLFGALVWQASDSPSKPVDENGDDTDAVGARGDPVRLRGTALKQRGQHCAVHTKIVSLRRQVSQGSGRGGDLRPVPTHRRQVAIVVQPLDQHIERHDDIRYNPGRRFGSGRQVALEQLVQGGHNCTVVPDATNTQLIMVASELADIGQLRGPGRRRLEYLRWLVSISAEEAGGGL